LPEHTEEPLVAQQDNVLLQSRLGQWNRAVSLSWALFACLLQPWNVDKPKYCFGERSSCRAKWQHCRNADAIVKSQASLHTACMNTRLFDLVHNAWGLELYQLGLKANQWLSGRQRILAIRLSHQDCDLVAGAIFQLL
jgi:hypothetical protein